MASLNSVTVGAGSCSGGGGGNANGSNRHNVFVYGSLLADDVVRVLLRRIPQNSPAILHGYHGFSIKGRVYPAILPVENKKITGRDTSDIFTHMFGSTKTTLICMENGILRCGKSQR